MEEELLVPRELIEAIVDGKENKGANQEFEARIREYLEECEARNLKPSQWWIELLRGLAAGKNIIQILDELEVVPYGFGIFNILEQLQLHGFPGEFLQKLIEEAAPTIGERKAPIFMKNLGLI